MAGSATADLVREGWTTVVSVTSLEIIAILAGVPLAIMVLLGVFTLGPNLRRPPRYRPGQEWNHPPVWWMANPEMLRDAQGGHHTGAGYGGCRGDW